MPEHVPTVRELVDLGLAQEVVRMIPIGKGKKFRRDVTYRVSDEGHALMGAAMRRNAEEAIAAGVGDWVQPPSRTLPGLTGAQ